MDNYSERLYLFKKAKEVCVKKLNIGLERPESFLRILKELQFRFPDLNGVCEILYDFYYGGDFEKKEILEALDMIEYQ